ncbi:MAG TPA: XdhC/CoxI family protein [Actinomycetota bacterium]|nr:XdhC/CoxI family protein [Actinomycetota bacterium]
MGEIFDALRKAIDAQDPVALVTEVQGPNPGAKMLVGEESVLGSLGDEGLDGAVLDHARGMIEMSQTGTRTYGPQGQGNSEEVEVFIQAFSQPPDMYVLGAVNLASAVVHLGKFLGYKVTLVDARKIFANRDRYPEADEVIVQWPNEFLETAPISKRTAIVILTHDPKFDIPILEFALKSPVGYIGAMGSRRTHEKRKANLREVGITDEEIARVHAPLGIDLGSRTPEETAVSIMAQIIALRSGRSGGHLDQAAGRIHS